MNAADLNKNEQGPSHCASRCHELGMEMGALVLVGDSTPGCVCQPRGTQKRAARQGASASTTGHVVSAAAAEAARRQQQQQRQRQRQQQTIKPR